MLTDSDDYDDDDDDDGEAVSYAVFMRPPFAPAVVDLLKHYDCRQVWYLYNSNEGIHTVRFAPLNLRSLI